MFNISQKSNVRQIKVYESNILLRKKYLTIRGNLKTVVVFFIFKLEGGKFEKKIVCTCTNIVTYLAHSHYDISYTNIIPQ